MILKIYNKDWVDTIILNNETNIIQRESGNKDSGKCILNDNFLLINWDNWGKEIFYSNNNNEYYQISDDNYFKLDMDISIIYIINNDYSDSYILDHNTKKIYNNNTLNIYSNYIINFHNKYYEKTYFNKLFETVFLDNIKYILLKNSDICYENFNIFKKKKYMKYENKIKINNIEYVCDSDNERNYTYSSRVILDNNKLNSNKYDELLNSNETLIFIDNICNYKNIICNHNNYILFTNIILNNLHNLHNLHKDLNIIYYYDLEDIPEFIDKYNITNLYINIHNAEKKPYLKKYNLLSYDVKILWFEINKHHLEKYEYNYIYEHIPKIMHFIWLGNNKMPDIYLEYINSWIKHHNDWTFCFWNDDNIPALINQKLYDKTHILAMKADILRYELLYIFGGVYVDCDFLCLRNINDIIMPYTGFSGYESEKYIAIGLMGFIPYDNMLNNIIKELSRRENENENQMLSLPELSGPVFFTNMWNKYKTEKHFSFPINYFYSYSFQDKENNKTYIINDDNYAIHMWGHSWKDNYVGEISPEYYLTKIYLSKMINDNIDICESGNQYELTTSCTNNHKHIKYSEMSSYLRNKIYFKANIRKKIVNIMGVFGTGGIERYLYYIDKYGNHELYEYYLLYIANDKNTYAYKIKNIRMISFDWNHDDLNKLLIMISPDLIIDHYSLYVSDIFTNTIYKNINKNIIITFIHSAICYNNDITNLNINKCIHLYNEQNKHISWKNIDVNYYITLGTELGNAELQSELNKIKISIIGRITEEKIPISFFAKLCEISNNIFDKIEIHIYGEKDLQFNKEYIDNFNILIQKSKIILHSFVNPKNIYEIYNDTDILLIPSIYETGSFTCIEAFSYGIPVIARNVYGLKYLIKSGITGYLCNNDDEIISKISNICKIDILAKHKDIINESQKYNIVSKIADFEIIINENITEKNLVIITSVINCVDKPLSYYHKRSIFTIEERYDHTLKSILSIKKYIPNVEILFCECSDMSEYMNYEENIKNSVDYYYNFNDISVIKKSVDSLYKGLGEAYILLNAFRQIGKPYKNIFKLSGRYYLNDNFDYDVFNNNYQNIFTNWEKSDCSYCTVFYKINGVYLNIFKDALMNSITNLEENISIECCIFKYFNKNIMLVDKLNVSGCLATEGYLFTI
jgi:mannosyltransferase OCH1-like enzyme/glycosyltransferase involved in cell wall biosynthesis